MNVLFFMSHGLLARNFEWLLRELTRRGHRVHVALDHMDKPGMANTNNVLEEIARECPGLSFGSAPTRGRATISFAGRAFRLVLDYLRYLEPGYADAEKPRARMTARIPRSLRLVSAPLLRSPRGRASIGGLLRLADEGVPVDGGLTRFVSAFAPDVILVTPLVDPGSPQTDYVRAARTLEIPSLLAVHSWDNLTLKGGIHEVPDVVAVWNDVQRQEAVRLHGIPSSRVVVTGAVAYDHWFDWEPASTRAEFCAAAGLDPERAFLLYLGSSRFIAPDESTFIREWNSRIRQDSPELADVQVVLRPHPLNPFVGETPEGLHIAAARDVEPYDADSRASYFDAIHHSAAVVGILTSGMIEAAIVDRPVHTLLVDRYRDTQRATAHFRHLLPENGGMIIVGGSYDEHADQLRRSLLGEAWGRNRPFVDSFVRASAAGASASSVLADAIEALPGMQAAVVARPAGRRAAAAVVARTAWALMRLVLLLKGSVATHAPGAPGPAGATRPVRDA
ncbi:MAG: hypothetical protein ACR2MU_06620 [Gaiellaceae bacterium]